MADDAQPTLAQHIAEIEGLTAQMRERAQAADWPELARLEAQRRVALEALFGRGLADSDAMLIALIERLLAADREIIECVEALQGELRARLGAAQSGRRALQAYEDNV